MLRFDMLISLFLFFFSIDFCPLIRYCVGCKEHKKTLNAGGKSMTSMKKRIAATLMATILATALTVPASAEPPAIRLSSYKGSTLEVGERSGLIVGPSGTEYTVTSSAPDTVSVEQVLTFWVAVAKAEGTAEITAFNSAGEYGTMTLAVGSAAPAAPEAPVGGDSTCLTDNLEIRQRIIRLINQTRKANGVSELPVNEALMNAA
jgi:hypothetical protein